VTEQSANRAVHQANPINPKNHGSDMRASGDLQRPPERTTVRSLMSLRMFGTGGESPTRRGTPKVSERGQIWFRLLVIRTDDKKRHVVK
jgi:hypothetical protein